MKGLEIKSSGETQGVMWRLEPAQARRCGCRVYFTLLRAGALNVVKRVVC
jgi:hypothetical protein